MTTRPELEAFVTLGVNTHKDTHVAVALDQPGPVAAGPFDPDPIDRAELARPAQQLGIAAPWLARWLTARGWSR